MGVLKDDDAQAFFQLADVLTDSRLGQGKLPGGLYIAPVFHDLDQGIQPIINHWS